MGMCVRLRDRHCCWWRKKKYQRVKLHPPSSSHCCLPLSSFFFFFCLPHHSMLLCTVHWCPVGPEIAMDMMRFLISSHMWCAVVEPSDKLASWYSQLSPASLPSFFLLLPFISVRHRLSMSISTCFTGWYPVDIQVDAEDNWKFVYV